MSSTEPMSVFTPSVDQSDAIFNRNINLVIALDNRITIKVCPRKKDYVPELVPITKPKSGK